MGKVATLLVEIRGQELLPEGQRPEREHRAGAGGQSVAFHCKAGPLSNGCYSLVMDLGPVNHKKLLSRYILSHSFSKLFTDAPHITVAP